MIESAKNVYSTEYIEETAAYIRVSTTEQKMHGLSLESQVQKLEDYAKNNNMKIVEWYKDEGVSGRKLIRKRPELQRMLHDAQKGRFKRIIFIKLDRFFRSVGEFHEAQKILDEANVTWTATEEKYDMSTANGRAFVNMKIVISELEADTAGERVKIVNEYKVREGMPLTGNYPFCYTVGQPEAGERHKYVMKQDEEIMEDLLAHFMVNQSIRGAMFYINKKYNRSFGYNAIRRALTNEMICGTYRGNPNYCKPYVTREMFEQIQVMVKRNPRTSNAEHAYIFTGLIKCPGCGTILGSAIHNNRSGRHSYGYRCRKFQKEKKCDFKTLIFETTIEKKVLAAIEGIIEVQEIKNIEIAANTERVSKYDVNELQAELDRLNYSWQKGRIKDVKEYDEKYDKLVAQIEAANSEIVNLAGTPDYERIKTILSAGWQEIYKELDNEHKRAFWRAFVEEIIVDWTRENKEVIDIKFF